MGKISNLKKHIVFLIALGAILFQISMYNKLVDNLPLGKNNGASYKLLYVSYAIINFVYFLYLSLYCKKAKMGKYWIHHTLLLSAIILWEVLIPTVLFYCMNKITDHSIILLILFIYGIVRMLYCMNLDSNKYPSILLMASIGEWGNQVEKYVHRLNYKKDIFDHIITKSKI